MADSATAGEAFACALKWAEEDEDSVRQAALCRWAQVDDVDPHSALDLRIRRARLLGDAHVQVARHRILAGAWLIQAHQVEANGHLVSLGMLEGRDRAVTARSEAPQAGSAGNTDRVALPGIRGYRCVTHEYWILRGTLCLSCNQTIWIIRSDSAVLVDRESAEPKRCSCGRQVEACRLRQS